MAVPGCTNPCAATDVIAGSALTCTPRAQSVSITDDTNDAYDIYSNLAYTAATDSWVSRLG